MTQILAVNIAFVRDGIGECLRNTGTKQMHPLGRFGLGLANHVVLVNHEPCAAPSPIFASTCRGNRWPASAGATSCLGLLHRNVLHVQGACDDEMESHQPDPRIPTSRHATWKTYRRLCTRTAPCSQHASASRCCGAICHSCSWEHIAAARVKQTPCGTAGLPRSLRHG